jgi:UDP-glucose 4-epimerase
MKILITGIGGFVGTETSKLLIEKGHEVLGFDIMNSQDIRDKKQFDAFVSENKPDRILHLAAIARFADADKNPLLAHEVNVIGTKNVVEVCEKYHVPLVYSSTGSAIMPLDDFEPPYKETIPARGNSIYGSTKAMGEYYVSRHTPHIILRYGHLYGAEKRMHGLIGGFLDRIGRGMAPTLMGGRQTNDFVYILDVARANWLALIAPWSSWNNIYNIGSGEELSAKEAGDIICELSGWTEGVDEVKSRPVDPSRFIFDIKKAELMLNFKAEYSFRDGLSHMFSIINKKI